MGTKQEIRIAAIEVRQSRGRVFYVFGIDGKLVHSFATVSRLKRGEEGSPQGYQRPEVMAHISEIRDYIESESPMIPNAVIIAFDGRVRFEPALPFMSEPEYTRVGTLVIPVEKGQEDDAKPGFIVDGQQRLAAVRDAQVPSFPVAVTAFITNDVRQQVEQFILINSTKPLQKALIYELLPNTDGKLPTPLEKRRFPAFLLDRLNRDEDSPFRGRIQTPTTPPVKGTTQGIIKDNSVLRMLENSLSDGALYRFRGFDGKDHDVESMLHVVKNFWTAASRVFSQAWNLPPRKSRLVHGVGIVSLGFIMDASANRRRKGIPPVAHFQEDLEELAEVCRWTDGYWDFGRGHERKWNELQNTTKDVELLSNFFRTEYRLRVLERLTERAG